MTLKTVLKSVLRRAGYAVYAIPKAGGERRGDYAYAEAHPNATLAPWLTDDDFIQAFEVAKSNTLVDIYRLHELWSLVAETDKAGGDIVEVGVWRGGSGCLMAKKAQLMGANSTVWLCDTFSGVVKAGDQDSYYRGGEHSDTSEAVVSDLAVRLGLNNIKTLTGIFPDDTGAQLDASAVRLLHIDVDVYQSARDTVDYLWDRMPSGAAIVFDDYGFVGCEGVTRYADSLRERQDLTYLHNLNGHAVLVKR